MVVVAALGAGLGVAAGPGADIDRVDGLPVMEWVAGQQVAERLDVHPAVGERGVGAAPAPLVDRLQAQVGKRWDRWSGQQRISQLQQGIGTAGEAGVQLGAEGAQLAEGGSRLGHDRGA
jgi:hypothetical protein